MQATRNPAATAQASLTAARIDGYLGLTRLHHLSEDRQGVQQTFRVPVAVRLHDEKSPSLQILQRLTGGSKAQASGIPVLWTLSIGLTEFRPPRGEERSLAVVDGTTHLYPFWHARLASPSFEAAQTMEKN
jgi:hypothetical protein